MLSFTFGFFTELYLKAKSLENRPIEPMIEEEGRF
jgi:hypothetical protein